jgi:hypothetical protein
LRNDNIKNNLNLPEDTVWDDLEVRGPLSASELAWIPSNDLSVISEGPELLAASEELAWISGKDLMKALESACLSMIDD